MGLLVALATVLGHVNAAVLALGRGIGIACIAVMVVFILIQVFFRYVLGNALPWSEEGARFLMLWMTGLMAPTAFRRGGFVSIEMLVLMLPRALAAFLSLCLLCISLLVLVAGFRIGWAEVAGFGGRFATDALWIPTTFDLSEWRKVPRAWTMASLAVGITLLIAVNVELMLRAVITMFGGGGRLSEITGTQTERAE